MNTVHSQLRFRISWDNDQKNNSNCNCVCICVYTCLHACLCVYSCTHDMVVSGRACEAVFLFPLCMGSEGSGSQDDFSIMARRQ